MTIIYQPKGAGTELKNGTILVKAPAGATASGVTANYTIDTYVSDLPTTGEINAKYDVRFTGCDICN
jgi:hypothetical protein